MLFRRHSLLIRLDLAMLIAMPNLSLLFRSFYLAICQNVSANVKVVKSMMSHVAEPSVEAAAQ